MLVFTGQTSKAMYWLSHPTIHDYYQKRSTAYCSNHWVNYIAESIGNPSEKKKILSMGCGEGALERHLCNITKNWTIDAIDFCKDNIEKSILLSGDLAGIRIKYFCDDFSNYLDSSVHESHYDAIIYNMSLHHAPDPYTLLLQTKTKLAANGVLILNEYIGPARLQVSGQIRKIIDYTITNLLASEGSIRGSYHYPSIERVIKADPSEAINPAIIPYAVSELFQNTRFNPISSSFLSNVTEHFKALSTGDAATLCFLDSFLLAQGILDADYQLIIASI